MSAWSLAAETQLRRQAGLYRQPRILDYRGASAYINDRWVRVFCSNDYLGLAVDSAVIAAFQQAAARYGLGSSGAHLITGHRREHQALEEELADFFGRSRALLFSSGYMANMGLIDALVREGDAVFQDWLNHASLYDGGRLSGAAVYRYQHVDLENLSELLQDGTYRRRLIISDGLFSMDGDVAPLPELVKLARANAAWLMVGDAQAALALSKGLEDDGFLVTAIRPPTVPAGTARLRITLSALHTDADIDALLDALARRCRHLPEAAASR